MLRIISLRTDTKTRRNPLPLTGQASWLLAALLILAPGRVNGDVPVLALPPVSVSANVPLVKVGEFRLLEPRFAPAAVAQGRYVYIIGGLRRKGQATGTIERLDVVTGRSEIIGRLRVPRFWHHAVLVQNRIFVLGGSVAKVSTGMPLPTDSMEIFDLETGRVSAGERMPQPVRSFSCVAIGDQIAVMGGSVGGETAHSVWTNQMAVYDGATGKWSGGFPLPAPTSNGAAAIAGVNIVVTGGYDGTAHDTVMALDRRTGKWQALQPLCRPSSAHSMVLLDDRLFLFGDYSKPEELLVYDLKTQKSETFTLSYTPARHTAAVVANRKVYVVGGKATKGDAPLDIVQVFTPITKAAAQEWRTP